MLQQQLKFLPLKDQVEAYRGQQNLKFHRSSAAKENRLGGRKCWGTGRYRYNSYSYSVGKGEYNFCIIVAIAVPVAAVFNT